VCTYIFTRLFFFFFTWPESSSLQDSLRGICGHRFVHPLHPMVCELIHITQLMWPKYFHIQVTSRSLKLSSLQDSLRGVRGHRFVHPLHAMDHEFIHSTHLMWPKIYYIQGTSRSLNLLSLQESLWGIRGYRFVHPLHARSGKLFTRRVNPEPRFRSPPHLPFFEYSFYIGRLGLRVNPNIPSI